MNFLFDANNFILSAVFGFTLYSSILLSVEPVNTTTTEDHWFIKAAEPEVIIPFSVVVLSGAFYLYQKNEEQKKELGRLQFLDLVTNKMEEIVSTRVNTSLTSLDERMTKVHEQLQVQFVKTEHLDRLYTALTDRVTNLETCLLRYFEDIEDRIAQSLTSLPCVDHTVFNSHRTLKFIPCHSSDDKESRLSL